jgi:nucleoside-diphosphate-sugar epimerase
MTTAFVAGSTGLVGRFLVAVLVQRGVATVAHVRLDSKQLQQWKARFGDMGATCDTTPWDPAAMAATLHDRGITHAFCSIGTTAARARHDGQSAVAAYETVDFGLCKLLADACKEAGCVERFVHVSALGTGPNARGAYLQWRWKAETAVRQAGVPFTIARPSFIVGERDDKRPGEKVAAAMVDAGLDFLGALGATRLRDRFHAHDPRTLAEALARLAFDPQAAGKVVGAEGLRG